MRAIHPGEILHEEIILANKLTEFEAAKMMGITYHDLYEFIQGRLGVTPELSIKISNVFGGTPDIWINLQNKFDNR